MEQVGWGSGYKSGAPVSFSSAWRIHEVYKELLPTKLMFSPFLVVDAPNTTETHLNLQHSKYTNTAKSNAKYAEEILPGELKLRS